MEASKAIDFDKSGGIIPAIAQDFRTHRILMVAWMNREAFEETVRTRRACYWSRSRSKLWRKGEESGNFQTVHEIRIDCDADIVLLSVEQAGDRAACHEGYESCFFRRLDGDIWSTTANKVVDPAKYGPDYGHHPKRA